MHEHDGWGNGLNNTIQQSCPAHSLFSCHLTRHMCKIRRLPIFDLGHFPWILPSLMSNIVICNIWTSTYEDERNGRWCLICLAEAEVRCRCDISWRSYSTQSKWRFRWLLSTSISSFFAASMSYCLRKNRTLFRGHDLHNTMFYVYVCRIRWSWRLVELRINSNQQNRANHPSTFDSIYNEFALCMNV